MTEPARDTPRSATADSATRHDRTACRRGAPSRATVAERPPALDLARRIVELAEDKKAADIVLLDLTGLTTSPTTS